MLYRLETSANNLKYHKEIESYEHFYEFENVPSRFSHYEMKSRSEQVYIMPTISTRSKT